LAAGAFLLALAVRGLKTGSAQLVYRYIPRSEDAVLYWTAIVTSVVFGAALVLGAVFQPLNDL